MNIKTAVKRTALSLAALSVVGVLDATTNEAEAATKVIACKPKGQVITGNIQCIQFPKAVRGRANKPGPALRPGYGYVRGPSDATAQFKRYGGWVKATFGTAHVIRSSHGCTGGFRGSEFCGEHVLRGSTNFWSKKPRKCESTFYVSF